MNMRWIALVVVMLLSSSASAQDLPVRGRLVQFPGGGPYAVVWRSPEALRDGIRITAAGGDRAPEIAVRYVRCIPPVGTRVAILGVAGDNPGRIYEVTVLEGQDAGCRGWIIKLNLQVE
jgi:hypothetical protein